MFNNTHKDETKQAQMSLDLFEFIRLKVPNVTESSTDFIGEYYVFVFKLISISISNQRVEPLVCVVWFLVALS